MGNKKIPEPTWKNESPPPQLARASIECPAQGGVKRGAPKVECGRRVLIVILFIID